MAQTDIQYEQSKLLRRDYSVNIQWRPWLLCTALPLTDIYLSTKFYLNATCSFKVIYLPDKVTDGRTKRRLYASPFGELKNQQTR